MSLAGVGTVLDAVSRARYMARQMAFRRAPHVRLRVGGGEATERVEDEWEPHECFHLCRDCGYLSEGAASSCPGCKSSDWIDLRRTAAAERLCAVERSERLVVPRSLARWGTSIALALGLGVAGLAVWSRQGLSGVSLVWTATVALILGGFTAAVGSWIAPRLLVFIVYRRRPTFPLRWRLPAPLPSSGSEPTIVVEGYPQVAGELLRAPLSGEPCIAYEVSVLFDATGDLRPPMWILEEERSLGFLVSGQEVAADRVTLDLPIRPVGDDSPEGDRAATLFLRKRGLLASEGDYTFFEALVRPGEVYRLELFEGKAARISRAP